MSRLTTLSEQSFKYLAYTPMHNLAGVFGTQWELSWRRKEKNIDAGEERTDDKGYRVIRVELAGGKACDLLAPVETLD